MHNVHDYTTHEINTRVYELKSIQKSTKFLSPSISLKVPLIPRQPLERDGTANIKAFHTQASGQRERKLRLLSGGKA